MGSRIRYQPVEQAKVSKAIVDKSLETLNEKHLPLERVWKTWTLTRTCASWTRRNLRRVAPVGYMPGWLKGFDVLPELIRFGWNSLAVPHT